MSYQLTEEEVEAIQANLELNETGELIPYSGRFMYGKHCLGITTDDIAKCFMLLASEFGRDSKRSELITELCEYVRYDNMGRGDVVYFPEVTLPESFVDEDEDFE